MKRPVARLVPHADDSLFVAIEEWIIGKNAERDRKVLRRRLIDGVTFERLAEEQELSVSQVKRIIWKNAEIIFRHLKMN